MISPSTLLTAAVATGIVPAAAANDRITVLVLEGDAVPGVGNVTGIDNLAVNDSGQWIVEARTDADPTIDAVLIRDGLVVLQQGDALAEPAGAWLSTATSTTIPFDAAKLDSAGRGAFNFTLEGTAGGTADNAGVYRDLDLIVQKGLVLNGVSTFGNGTVLGTFSDVKMNESGQMLVVGTADDPNVTGTTDWYVMVVAVDPQGNVLSISRVAGEGDLLPGQTQVVNTIRSSPHGNAINVHGDVLFGADLLGDDAFDAVVYMNSAVLAQQGMPSPVAGRVWGDLVAPEIDLNDAGDWTLKDKLDNSDTSTDDIIVKNGLKFIQQGDTLPAISPSTFTYFGNGPACLTAAGQVLWFGEWDDGVPETVDRAYFLNGEIIVQAGVTPVAGQVIAQVGFQSDNYFISPNGRWVIFEATLASGLEGAFLLDLQAPTRFCSAAPNSTGLAGVMGCSGSTSVAANDFVLEASFLPPSMNGLFIYSASPLDPPLALGNGFLCLSNADFGFILRLPPETSTAGGVMTHALDNTAPPAPVGQITPGATWYFSCWHRDNFAPPAFFNFADGLAVTFGP